MQLRVKASKANQIIVSRAIREEHHCFSILAWDHGFEYLFPSGINRWSSIGNHHIKTFTDRFADAIKKKQEAGRPLRSTDYMQFGTWEGDDWIFTKPIPYKSMQEAIEFEVGILNSERERYPDDRWMGPRNLKNFNQSVSE